jgi:peptidoglycan/xylan/chitin deacetylase (PgdA/CDA1 family)
MTFPILLYHGVDSGETWSRVLDDTDREYVLDRARFEQHIAFLAERGIPVRSLDECLRADAPEKEGTRPVVITFDDGDVSCFTTSAPVLERYGFRAEFFVVSRWIGQPGFLTVDHLRDLIRRGHRVHSHSRTHPVLPSLEPAQIDEEVVRSKAEIEAMTGTAASYFSIPGGAFDERVVDAARRAGYARVLSSIEGYNDPRQPSYLLRRFTPRSYTDVRFVASVCLRHRLTSSRLVVKRIALSAARRVLGGASYARLRSAVVSQKARKD